MKLKIFIASLFLATNAWATLTQCDQIPAVVHINGITTTIRDARKNTKWLYEALEQELGHPVKTDLAYNQTHGFFADIAQTFYQLSQQNPDTAPEQIAEALLYGNAPEGMDARVAEAAIRYYQAKAEQAALAQLTLDEEGEILRDIRRATAEADKVLLVPHSQGNLFANRMYTLLTESGELRPQDLRIHGFASPADRVLGNGSYLTSRYDVVISSLDLLRKVLPHNIEIPRTKADLLGHGFKEVYLNPSLNGREAATTGLLAAMAAMNTTPYPADIADSMLSRAPLIFDFYGPPFNQQLWQAAGWDRPQGFSDPDFYGNNIAWLYLKGPRGIYSPLLYRGDDIPRGFMITTVVGIATGFRDQDDRYHYVYGLTCDMYPETLGSRLEPGTYEILGDYVYQPWEGKPDVLLNEQNNFALTYQGTRHNYLFGQATQRRAFDDQIIGLDDGSRNAFGYFSLVLGKIIVTQNETTGRYKIDWQPTPELAATEVR
ncbi:hypothetical protein [Chitiniphilus eburneus]|uniref:Uncharacterized protein n=1 Tax=Chitiniphilus eburneus TaxID=2571148 RepID=A0A4U0PFB2_9NEIS|nr:hypothetical protein [Chitiniphilus eburneus]TJZ66379.1 hypothetical protein FAZ21_17280 [Chitiniphilus eburneus]